MKVDKLKWRRFEKLVANITEHLHPGAHVEHDVHIEGRSGVTRQVDVVVWESEKKEKILLFIDCKDYEPSRGNIGIGTVDEFIGTVIDFDVHSAALVTFSDFTDEAKMRASGAGIKLWRAADTGDHDWKADLSIPVLIRSVEMKSASFTFIQNSAGPFQMMLARDMRELMLYARDKNPIGTTGDLLMKAWNDGLISYSAGTHERVIFVEQPTMVQGEDDELYFVTVLANPTVIETFHLVNLGIEELSGFYDLHSGVMMTRGFTTAKLDVTNLDETADVIDVPQALAIKPFIQMELVDKFELDE